MNNKKILKSLDEVSNLIHDLHTMFMDHLRGSEYKVISSTQENKLFLMEGSLQFIDKRDIVIEEIIIRIRNYNVGFELIFGGKYRYKQGDEGKYENPPLSMFVIYKNYTEKPTKEKTLINLSYRPDLVGKRKNWYSLKKYTYDEIRVNFLNELYVEIKKEIDSTLGIV